MFALVVPISLEISEYVAALENEGSIPGPATADVTGPEEVDILHVMGGDELADYHSTKSTGGRDRTDSHPLKTPGERRCHRL